MKLFPEKTREFPSSVVQGSTNLFILLNDTDQVLYTSAPVDKTTMAGNFELQPTTQLLKVHTLSKYLILLC